MMNITMPSDKTWELQNFTIWNNMFLVDEANDNPDTFYHKPPKAVMLTAAFQGFLSFIGWIANLIVIIAVLVKKKKEDSHFFLYILQLAISNFIFLTTVPFKIQEMLSFQWNFGQALCRIVTLCTYLNFTVVALILMLMSLDRYFAAFRTTSKFRSKKVANWGCLLVWFVSFCGALPLALLHSADENMKCNPKFPGYTTITSFAFLNTDNEKGVKCTFPSSSLSLTIWITSRFLYSFLLPFLVITFCYGSIVYRIRGKTTIQAEGAVSKKFRRKVTVMCFIGVVSYAICYTPYYTWQVGKLIGIPVKHVSTCFHMQRFNTTMVYLNSVLQPLMFIGVNAHAANPKLMSDCAKGFLLKERRRQTLLR